MAANQKVNITVSHNHSSNAPNYEVHVDPVFVDELQPEGKIDWIMKHLCLYEFSRLV